MPNGYGKHPSVSIIILNYNGRDFVERCLKSVLNTDYPNFEVVFVDNASTDGSPELVKKMFGSDPRLKFIHNDNNLGFAEGNNIGARAAKGEYIVFLNNDTEVDPNWIEEIVKVMESDLTIGIAQSKLRSLGNRRLMDCAGGFIDHYGWSHRRGEREEDRGQFSKVDEIFYAVGAAMVVRRGILNKVEMFDPNYFIYFEDTDLCWRVWLSGHRVVFVPASIVFHMVRGTMKKQPVRTIFLGCRNNITTLLKNYELCNVVKYLPANLMFICVVATFRLLKGEINMTLAYFKAILWNILNLKHIWAERLRVQHLIRKISDDKLSEQGIILEKPIFVHMLQKQLWRRKLSKGGTE
jgi:GT2 family glycosyltransferase